LQRAVEDGLFAQISVVHERNGIVILSGNAKFANEKDQCLANNEVHEFSLANFLECRRGVKAFCGGMATLNAPTLCPVLLDSVLAPR
jgi:hypothetical protein